MSDEFKRIDRALVNTGKALGALQVERDGLARMLENPAFARRHPEIEKLILEVDGEIQTHSGAARQLRAALDEAMIDAAVAQAERRIHNIKMTLPGLAKWLKRLTKGKSDEPSPERQEPNQ